MINYIKAARLRTLPLSVSGIIVGSLMGFHDVCCVENYIQLSSEMVLSKSHLHHYLVFCLAILTTIGFQVLSNFANDYGDGVKGTDNERQGEVRMVASGAISPQQMKRAIIVTGILALGLALVLIFVSFGKDNFLYSLVFLVLGLLSIVAAIKYTVGKSAYGYSGFGDLFVFIFFGIVAVAGTYFLYTKTLNLALLLPASAIGFLSTAVLNLNNMRDQKNDAKAGKNTVVVKLGAHRAKYYHYSLLISSFICALLYTFLTYQSPFQFIFIIAYLPLLKHALFVFNNQEEKLLDAELKKVALSTFFFALLFGLGYIL